MLPQSAPNQPRTYPQGAQGRTNRRRVSSGESACSRATEGQALEAWFKETHLGVPCPTAKTIQNKLPTNFRPRANHVPK